MTDEFRQTDVADLFATPQETALTKPLDNLSNLPNIISPLAPWSHNYQMLKFMKRMQSMDPADIDHYVVHQTYPAALWKMREFALNGLYTETRAAAEWLKWAKEVLKVPNREPEKNISPGSADFGAREPDKVE